MNAGHRYSTVPPGLNKQAAFTTTRWSLVLEAGSEESPRVFDAMEQLCGTYWYPIYVFVRRSGYGVEDAQDLTQGFFTRVIHKRHLAGVRPDRGRFRSYLLVALKHYLINEAKHEKAQKRGGGQRIASLNDCDGESRYLAEPREEVTPEHLYERRWALTLLSETLAQLEQEWMKAGKEKQYMHLRVFLTADKDSACNQDIAREMGVTRNALKLAVFRMRKRYRQLLRQRIADTVSGPHEVEDEIRHLIRVMS